MSMSRMLNTGPVTDHYADYRSSLEFGIGSAIESERNAFSMDSSYQGLPSRTKLSNEGATRNFNNAPGRTSPLLPAPGQAPESTPRSQTSLPSIRQLFTPEVLEPRRSDGEHRNESPYPTLSRRDEENTLLNHPRTSPMSHGKRRLSDLEDQGVYSSGHSPVRQHKSPGSWDRRSHSVTASPTDPRRFSIPDNRASIYPSPPRALVGALPPIRALPHLDSPHGSPQPEWRPSLPPLTTNHISNGSRGQEINEYALAASRTSPYSQPTSASVNGSPYVQHSTYSSHSMYNNVPYGHHPSAAYGYQQPRGHSYSGPSPFSAPHDRSPFSMPNGTYHGTDYSYGLDLNDGDTGGKKGKRRGNLPKETTDKLRSWFHSNLVHPYPTEDQKQELMQQTGLQMNQISNWFINARRRQLPNLIMNARAEHNARISRGDGSGRDEDDMDKRRRRHSAEESDDHRRS